MLTTTDWWSSDILKIENWKLKIEDWEFEKNKFKIKKRSPDNRILSSRTHNKQKKY
jgi:hypothetical protein